MIEIIVSINIVIVVVLLVLVVFKEYKDYNPEYQAKRKFVISYHKKYLENQNRYF